jgi:hypothetical protein
MSQKNIVFMLETLRNVDCYKKTYGKEYYVILKEDIKNDCVIIENKPVIKNY